MADTLAQDLLQALSKLSSGAPLRAGVTELLEALGYASQKTVDAGSVDDFLERFAPGSKLTEKQRKLFDEWKSVEIIFQFSADEISKQAILVDLSGFDDERIKSFLFIAVDLAEGIYTRTHLADTTRAINRLFAMPVIPIYRHGKMLTLAVIHRRSNMQDSSKDVLENVTLVKDIRANNPHRAHLDILADLSFSRMIESRVDSFDLLHTKWEQTLDIEVLNRRFYCELFSWFERAVETCRFPEDKAGHGSSERHIIRLITRLLFIWFLKEKELVPEKLFENSFANTVLKHHAPERTDYYRAVLQNLFFATLNTEISNRNYSGQDQHTDDSFTEYHYHDLLRDPTGFIEMLKRVPFVNGGLFNCLDDFPVNGVDGQYIDVFTDDKSQMQKLDVPAHLFIDHKDGLFPLFHSYKFTIEENTPLDQEVALDPELLGRVFENLLAAYNPETRETARRGTGSYYTPRQVVDYMVREALTEALASNGEPADGDPEYWRERLRYLLDHSEAMNDANELFEDRDRRTVVNAIANIRTLDPAVGSGAFPMGILQTLTLALRRLDPNNFLWEEVQRRRAAAMIGNLSEDSDQNTGESIVRDIRETFKTYRESDFSRKLYLIQNGIYGVDIQPIACQITKLRFFISLVIEQNLDPTTANLGIKPLPNLETQFVSADFLIDLKYEYSSIPFDNLFDDGIISKQKEIADIRERYFLADSRPTKLEYVDRDKALRSELRDMLASIGQDWIVVQQQAIDSSAEKLPSPAARATFRDGEFRRLAKRRSDFDANLVDAHKISEWDPFDQNACATWFHPKWMFDVSDGFDVVIGNPPYIQLQKDRGSVGRRYIDVGYETFKRTGDIYQLFYERGCRLLKSNTGVLAYITSNSWLRAEYGKPLRRWFASNHTPLRLVELGRGVFENAIVDTSVFLVRSGKDPLVECLAVDVDRAASYSSFLPPIADWGVLQPNGERPWAALSRLGRSVMDKIEAVGTPLKDWDISIYRGVLTGYNEAFIVDQATHDSLVADDPKSAEILRPIIRGRDIARYRARWAGQWLISTFPSIRVDIDKYPAIRKHLASFGHDRLEQVGRRLPAGGRSRKKTSHAWYELQDTCAYHAEFDKNKLLWIELADKGRFAYDADKRYGEATTFILTGRHLRYLCAILNSELTHWYLRHTAPTSGMGTLRWKKVYVETIPIPELTRQQQQPFVEIVDLLTTVENAEKDASVVDVERHLNELTYRLYGLTKAEVRMIANGV